MADGPKSHAETPPGERLANYFDNFFKTIVGISTLGASLTFNKIVQPPPPTSGSASPYHDYGFSPGKTLYLLSVSWLFFVLALAFTSFFASALSLWRPAAIKAFGTENTVARTKVLWFASGVSALLLAFILVAFMTLSLVVVAFAGPAGWVAVGFTSIFGILCFGTVVWRSPILWPRRRKRTQQVEKDQFDDYLTSPKRRPQREEKDTTSIRVESGREATRYSNQARGGVGQQERKQDDYDYTYGRSTSGDYRVPGASRYGREVEGYDMNRHGRASTAVSDVYEPGRFGQGGMIYDDGVREGLVMSRY